MALSGPQVTDKTYQYCIHHVLISVELTHQIDSTK